ncbi:MAG: 3'-5' exonuclease, partial [Chitinophagales bacterium]
DLLMDTIPIILPGFEDYDPGPITDLLQELLPEDILYPLGGEWDRLPPELDGTPELEDLQAALARLRGWLEVSALRPDELILHLAGDLGMSGDDLELASNLSIQVSRLLRENPEYGLNEIIEEMKQLERSTNFMASILRDSRGYTPRPGVVTIATQHRSKGLEWDIVIVAGLGLDEFPEKLNDKSKSEFGHLKAEFLNPLAAANAQLEYMRNGTRASKDAVIRQAKEDEIREGLRLLYVAFTRAREQLVIYGHRMNSYKKYLAKSEIWRELTRYVGEASQNANT